MAKFKIIAVNFASYALSISPVQSIEAYFRLRAFSNTAKFQTLTRPRQRVNIPNTYIQL